MSDIVKYIRNCLYETYYVGIPGLGSFVGTYAPASVDAITGNIRPPRKKIAFNSKIKLNDGYLVSMIAAGEGIDPAEAEMLIVRFAEQLNTELAASGAKELEGLGRFFIDEDRLCFEVDERQNFLNDSFALTDIRLTPVERTLHFKKHKHSHGMETTDTPITPQPQVRTSGKKPLKKKTAKKASSGGGVHAAVYVIPLLLITLVCGLGGYLYTREDVSQGSFNPAEWNWSAVSGKKALVIPEEDMNELGMSEEEAPVAEDEIAEEVSSETESFESEGFGESAAVEEKKPASVAASSTKATISESSENTITEKSNRYYVVVGSFSNEMHAAELREKLESEGKSSKIIAPFAPKNLHRVSIADFGDFNTALSTMEGLRGTYGNEIWVLVY